MKRTQKSVLSNLSSKNPKANSSSKGEPLTQELCTLEGLSSTVPAFNLPGNFFNKRIENRKKWLVKMQAVRFALPKSQVSKSHSYFSNLSLLLTSCKTKA